MAKTMKISQKINGAKENIHFESDINNVYMDDGTTLKETLDNIESYEHPATHSAAMITETDTKMFITKGEKEKINNTVPVYIGDIPANEMQEGALYLMIEE